MHPASIHKIRVYSMAKKKSCRVASHTVTDIKCKYTQWHLQVNKCLIGLMLIRKHAHRQRLVSLAPSTAHRHAAARSIVSADFTAICKREVISYRLDSRQHDDDEQEEEEEEEEECSYILAAAAAAESSRAGRRTAAMLSICEMVARW